MAKRDYYDILGVGKDADESAIKKAYRKVAMQYHPDRNPGDKAAEDKFKEAAEAYEVLSNPDKKARYDRYGHAGVDPNMGGGGRHYGSEGMTMDDIFSSFGDIFGDSGSPFESFFGGRGTGRGGRGQRGTNLRIKVKLTLEEIAHGTAKKIKVRKQVACQTCSGSGAKDKSAVKTCTTCSGAGHIRQMRNTFMGQMYTTAACHTCQGTGKMITDKCGACRGDGVIFGEEMIEFDVPAGVSEGMQMTLSGKGNAGLHGGPNGDLLVHFEEEPHTELYRDGSNIIYNLYLNFADAALGTSVEVPAIDGKIKIKIPPGTQAGKILRLKDKGLPNVQAYGKGDQLIQVNIWTPKNLTDKERELLESMRNMPNFKPEPGKGDRSFFERMKDFFS
jgi:molecular chaperone DnaJ